MCWSNAEFSQSQLWNILSPEYTKIERVVKDKNGGFWTSKHFQLNVNFDSKRLLANSYTRKKLMTKQSKTFVSMKCLTFYAVTNLKVGNIDFSGKRRSEI